MKMRIRKYRGKEGEVSYWQSFVDMMSTATLFFLYYDTSNGIFNSVCR